MILQTLETVNIPRANPMSEELAKLGINVADVVNVIYGEPGKAEWVVFYHKTVLVGESDLTTYHAFEIATVTGAMVYVTTDESERDNRLTTILSAHWAWDVETHAAGTVQAASESAAIAKILAGDWEYSQKA